MENERQNSMLEFEKYKRFSEDREKQLFSDVENKIQ